MADNDKDVFNGDIGQIIKINSVEREVTVRFDQREVVYDYHNKQYGIKWMDLTCYIEEYALGRKLTRAELKRFVEKNILTINRKRQ